MLRGPRALAPAAGPPLKGMPAMSPTELWRPGLGSPQLYPVTTTYYTPLYPQIVPPTAGPTTCLDATPHGPEGQAVRCVRAGRLPVILGTPSPIYPPLPLMFSGCGKGGRGAWDLVWVKQVQFGKGRGTFNF